MSYQAAMQRRRSILWADSLWNYLLGACVVALLGAGVAIAIAAFPFAAGLYDEWDGMAVMLFLFCNLAFAPLLAFVGYAATRNMPSLKRRMAVNQAVMLLILLPPASLGVAIAIIAIYLLPTMIGLAAWTVAFFRYCHERHAAISLRAMFSMKVLPDNPTGAGIIDAALRRQRG